MEGNSTEGTEQYLNNDLKPKLSRRGVLSKQLQFADRVSSLMELLKKRPKKIRFFCDTSKGDRLLNVTPFDGGATGCD